MSDKNENLDFSMESFWVASVASAIAYIAFRVGILGVETSGIQYLLSFLFSVIAYVCYLLYRRSKVISNASLNLEDIFTSVLASLFAQWAGVILLLIFGGRDNIDINSNQSVYYENCSDARAQGSAPVYSNEPGYRTALDRDRDGVGCE